MITPPTATSEDKDFAARLLSRFCSGLRGRLWPAGLLGVALAVAGGTAAWNLVPPLFRSEAVLRVNSYTPKILFSTEDTGVLPRYDKYLGAQAELIVSHRVTDLAMGSDVWSALNLPDSPEARRQFHDRLEVAGNPKSETITIAFSDEAADVAGRATEAVIDAYLQVQAEREQSTENSRLAALQQRRDRGNTELEKLRRDMDELTGAYGVDAVDTLYEARMKAKDELNMTLLLLNRDRAVTMARIESRDAEAAQPDPDARRMSQRIADLERAMQLKRLEGFGPESRWMQSAANEVKLLRAELEQQASTEVVTERRNNELIFIEDQIKTTQSELTSVNAAVEDLRGIAQRLRQLKELEADIEKSVAEVTARIDAISLESSQRNRIEVLSRGEVSTSPVNHTEILAKTALAGSGGMATGLLLVGGVGMLRREVRDTRDVLESSPGRSILGVIPGMETDEPADGGMSAAHHVEHLRSMVQLHLPQEERGVSLAVTGPVSGSGKTTAALLLARSFAASGVRTLIVDFDAEGRGLTDSVRRCCLPRIGEVLVQRYGVDQAAVLQALYAKQDQKLGEYLLDKGLITQRDLDRATHDMGLSPAGLDAAIRGEPLQTAVTATRWTGLDALLTRGERRMNSFGQKAINNLLRRAYEEYELVVVDTGPTPGSVEGAFAVAVTDCTLVIVARGDNRTEIEACDGFLRTVGAKIIGYVMNRCDRLELARLSATVSAARRTSRRGAKVSQPIDTLLASEL
ncbi:MAG: hypothetical protein AAF800_04560 [Planctomycetota bacterium]